MAEPLAFEAWQPLLQTVHPDAVISADASALQPWLLIHPDHLVAVCRFLKEDPRCWMDYLECLSAVDHGVPADKLGVVYHLWSIPHNHRVVLKVEVPRSGSPHASGLPVVPSVSEIWRTANWHEREAYDLMGIFFEGHNDLRRILTSEDWEGHALRKDYKTPESYHGIKIDY